MLPSEIIPEFLRIATLVRNEPPGWQEEYAEYLEEFTPDELGDLLLVAIGAIEVDYPDDEAWQEVCLAAVSLAEAYREEGR